MTDPERTRSYSTGFRYGSGPVAAVVRPGSLVEQWRVLQACVAADHIVIVQAANTGLTGGSTPDGEYDRPVVIISTTRISGIHLLRGGEQVLCLAGSTLHELERKLAPLGREPHSVIGSSCIGASVVGGVCNNSGGALVRRGPSYTEYALFARLGEDGELTLHNHLGIRLGTDPEAILTAVENGAFREQEIVHDTGAASAQDYESVLRDIEAGTPARFNADPRRLFEASGSAGRIAVFAVRLDTFPADETDATFYIGTNEPAELTTLRRAILRECQTLPVSAEYIHRKAFNVAADYGKDVFVAIEKLGTSRLPRLFAFKNWIDRLAARNPFLPANLSDRLMQSISGLFPSHLPRRMTEFRDRYEHHLILKAAGGGIEQTRALLGRMFPSASGSMFECTADEASKALLHRFAVAGAAIRYRAVHPELVEDIIALDVALRRNDEQWFETLPPEVAEQIVVPIYYGHFLCHVLHQDYVVRKGCDVVRLEQQMLAILDGRGASYPAEHNVGHHYAAKPELVAHYRSLDPKNQFNPGIGKTSRVRGWAENGATISTESVATDNACPQSEH